MWSEKLLLAFTEHDNDVSFTDSLHSINCRRT